MAVRIHARRYVLSSHGFDGDVTYYLREVKLIGIFGALLTTIELCLDIKRARVAIKRRRSRFHSACFVTILSSRYRSWEKIYGNTGQHAISWRDLALKH
jgi:hypothetical protein